MNNVNKIKEEEQYINAKRRKNLTEKKTRKEEIIFYIMHDKYCQKPNKEYRIRHTTLERTELINKSKDLYVVYYGNF